MPLPPPRVRALLAAACLTIAACAGGASRAQTAAAPLSREAILSGTLLVANQQAASASIVHLASGTVAHLPVGTGPHETIISSDGRWGVVTVYGAREPGNRLAVIDLTRDTVVRTIDLGEYARPHDVVFLPGSTSRIAVTSEASRNVVLVDIATGSIVAAVPTEARGSHMIALAGDGATAFTTNIPEGSISQIDLATRTFGRHIAIAPQVEGIAITPDGRAVWVGSNAAGTVSIVDVASGQVVDTLAGLGTPYRIAISPDGSRAAIPDPTGNRLIIADVRTRTVTGQITGIGSPRGVDIAPDNRTAFVTLGPEGAVSVVDLVELKELARYQVQAAPDGVGWGPAPSGR